MRFITNYTPVSAVGGRVILPPGLETVVQQQTVGNLQFTALLAYIIQIQRTLS